MARKYFGTDGIRGLVGVAPITPDFVMRLGYAAGQVLAKARAGAARPTVLIGKDTRISGYMLEAALEAGFSAAGVDVMLAGPMPTPAIAYLTRALRLSAGLDQPMLCVSSEKLGRAKRLDDAQGRYIEFCKSTFPNELDLRGLKIVVDCAHGAAYNIAPHVFYELGAEVIAIGNKPDGFNINAGHGATAPEAMSVAVRAHGADLGIALDGDADRYVLEVMQERGWILGGEGSGHLLCLDKHTTGDGIISALQVLSALTRSGKSLEQCAAELVLFPQTLINVRVAPGFDWTRNAAMVSEKEQVERELGDSGRVLIRASGTEPLIRVMVEARDAADAASMARRIADKVDNQLAA